MTGWLLDLMWGPACHFCGHRTRRPLTHYRECRWLAAHRG